MVSQNTFWTNPQMLILNMLSVKNSQSRQRISPSRCLPKGRMKLDRVLSGITHQSFTASFHTKGKS